MKPKKLIAADLFCGAGGASTGLVEACKQLGIPLDLLAVNHWPTAVETHSLNHPGVRHLCESIERIDPREVVPGGRLHLLLAGPECTHFSTARGGRPVNPQSRASAWHILKWAQELYIDTILIENVPEFRTWGPIGADHKPLKSRKGETYRAFLAALESLGYRVEDRILNAADYGDPTTRQRLFIIARKRQLKIAWPQATHSKHGGRDLFGSRKRWSPARDVIDWSLKGKSIFGRKKPLRPATMARILAGLEKFGGPDLKPFLVVLRQNMAGRSIDQPLPTVAAQGTHVGLAEPFVMHITHAGDENRSRSVDEPVATVTGAKRGELALVEPLILSAGGPKCPARPVSEPMGAVLTRDHRALVQAFVLQQQSGGVPRAVSEPLPTIAADGAISIVDATLTPAPFIVDAAFGKGEARRAHSIDDPVGTIPGSNRFAVVEPCIVQTNERRAERTQSVDDPLRTITSHGGRCFGLAEPFLVPMYGERPTQDPRTHSIEEPVPTIPATGGGKFGVVEPFILQQQSNGAPRSTEQPLPTIATAGKQALVEPFIFANRSNNAPKSIDEPVPPLCTGNHIAVVDPFVTKYYGTAESAHSVDEPLDTITAKDRFALVQPVVDGYALDIRFRMLQPHELSAAMSFPKGYQFKGTREEMVKQIGNAWAGRLAKALCLVCIDHHAARAKRTTRKAS